MYLEKFKKSERIKNGDKFHFTKKKVAEKSDIIVWSSCDLDRELRLKALFEKNPEEAILNNWEIFMWGFSRKKDLFRYEEGNTFTSVIDSKTENIAIARKDLKQINILTRSKAMNFPIQCFMD